MQNKSVFAARSLHSPSEILYTFIFSCYINVMLLYWNQMLQVNKCKSWNSLSKLLHKISASCPKCSEMPKISAVKLAFYFTVRACQLSGHSGLWTRQSCQLAVLSDEPVRPISSNISNRPGLHWRRELLVQWEMSCKPIRFNLLNYHDECLLPESRKQLLNVGKTKVLAA